MRVLFLGGARFVGPTAVRALVDAGHAVTVFHRGRSEPDLPRSVTHVHGDFASFGTHLDELRSLEPEVVVDTVPYIDKAGHGVAHFVHVAKRALVLTSGDVYRAFARLLRSEPGPPDPVPLREHAPLRTRPSPDLGPEIDYDNLEVERAVASLSLPTTVLRLPVVYGPNDPHDRLHGYLKRMLGGRPALLLEQRLADWRWSREYVENVGAAIAHAVADERSAGGIYNVAPAKTLTEHEWVRAIAEAAGWRGQIILASTADLPEELRASLDLRQEVVMDSARIRGELGFSPPVGLLEGLRRTIAWARRIGTASPDYSVEDAVLESLLGRGENDLHRGRKV